MTAPDLGPLPTSPFCAVQDAVSPRLAPILGQEPDGPLFTADQMRAERQRCYELGVSAERERCLPAWLRAALLSIGAAGLQRESDYSVSYGDVAQFIAVLED